MAEWVMVRESVLRDMRDQDSELATAAIASIASLPLHVLLQSATNLSLYLTALLTGGDAASECVRRSAVQGARYLLLRVGEVRIASDTSDAETKALHSLAQALAASALDSSAVVSCAAMESLGILCPLAPASSRLVGAQSLGDALCLPHTCISILAPPEQNANNFAAGRGWGSAGGRGGGGADQEGLQVVNGKFQVPCRHMCRMCGLVGPSEYWSTWRLVL